MKSVRPERLLRVKRIKKDTLLQYDTCVCSFRQWAKRHRKALDSDFKVDTAMSCYFNCLFEDDVAYNEGSYTLFGWIALKAIPRQPERELLPLARAALSAWRAARPGITRVGVPPQVIFHFAHFVSNNQNMMLQLLHSSNLTCMHGLQRSWISQVWISFGQSNLFAVLGASFLEMQIDKGDQRQEQQMTSF